MMKTITMIFQIFIIVIIGTILIFWLIGFKSAFEADQYCHYDLTTQNNVSANFGCDHDLETHQWILFENQDDSAPAKIIKRYRYRFL